MATLTLTCIGDDRPGLVSDLSGAIKAYGGSWERSQMARLAGKFAGILQVEVPDEHAEALVGQLTALTAVGLLVTVEATAVPTARERSGSTSSCSAPTTRASSPTSPPRSPAAGSASRS